MNRREWNKLMLASVAGFALTKNGLAGILEYPFFQAENEKFKGVKFGLQSYSLRDRSLTEAIEAMKKLNIKSCELWQGHIEPKGVKGTELTEWRSNVSLDEFRNVRKQFDKAGIKISAYTAGFRNEMKDEEMNKLFLMAKALGVDTMTSSATVSVTPRVDKFAQKHKIRVGMHNHDKFEDKDEFSNNDSFERALKGASNYIAINLDIGHLVAANEDPVAAIKKYHSRIVSLHIKDRKKNHGDNTVFGEGDTPIKEVLQLMKARNFKFPANIEYEYNGSNTIAEIERCMDYCRQALV
jgi:sugar phosphate isomerase/epimerase